MINFTHLSLEDFLNNYWQKKPVVIRNAIPDFVNSLSPDELAGLALEEEVESRIVWETPKEKTQWHLKRGPFTEQDFKMLPKSHWTLLVQGVDRLVPDIYELFDHFNFLPQWRIDDIMISFAALHGSVGPHYDNYDVFLYQAQGNREWSLTTKECNNNNYIQDLELRIMKDFDIEEKMILEEGDMLYLPPHVGHYGISLSEECMTYSFGYRSYQGQELWDSLGDYLSEKELFKDLYRDPNWSHLNNTSEITPPAWQSAQKLLRQIIEDEKTMKAWFGCFATRLDQQAEQQLSMPLEEEELSSVEFFINELQNGFTLFRDSSCRFAYQATEKENDYKFYINGCEWDVEGISPQLLKEIANNRFLTYDQFKDYISHAADQSFLFDLWKLQWLQIEEI